MRLTTAAPLALLLLCASAPSHTLHAQRADSARTHREAAQRYLVVTNARQGVEQNMAMLLKSQESQAPQMAAYTKVMRDFYEEQMSWSVLEPGFTQVYMEIFSEAELRSMIAFYQTALGQTMLAKMPAVMVRSHELTTNRLKAAMPQLTARLQAAMQAAIEAAGAQPPTKSPPPTRP